MPPGAISIATGRMCQFCVLSCAPPGLPNVAIGILLFDPQEEELHFKMRDDWQGLGLEEDDQDYLSALSEDFDLRISEMGAAAFLESLEDSLSGFLRISDRESIAVTQSSRTLQRLFHELVDSKVREYVTHLPLYSLRAAATKFGEDAEVDEAGWVLAPEGLHLTPDMFVAQVVGRSMEPLIPDGSRCVFRQPPVGSRQGRRLLIQEIKGAGSSNAFTVKRYTSRKSHTRPTEFDEGEWHHEWIRLEPLNPEFEAFELEAAEFESRYRVIAEFVQVLD